MADHLVEGYAGAVGEQIGHWTGMSETVAIVADFVVQAVVVFSEFATIFRFMPDAHTDWRDVAVGAAVTTVLFVVGRYAMQLYFSMSDPGAQLGSAVASMEDHVMAYLVEPLTTETLLPAIYLAERRFEHFQELVEKIDKLETRLADRKIIEKAKGIVMQARDLTEPEAHRLVQSTATKNRQKLVELARHVCEAGDILQPKRDEASGEGWQKNAR